MDRSRSLLPEEINGDDWEERLRRFIKRPSPSPEALAFAIAIIPVMAILIAFGLCR